MKKYFVAILSMVLICSTLAAFAANKYNGLGKMIQLTWDDPAKDKYSKLEYSAEHRRVMVVLTLPRISTVNWGNSDGKKFAQNICNYYLTLCDGISDGDELIITITETMSEIGLGDGIIVLQDDIAWGESIVAIAGIMDEEIYYTQLTDKR